MALDQNFPHPPKGHFGLVAYDSVNDRWQVVHVDADGNLQVDLVAAALPSGAATAAKQLADGHNVTVDNASLAVTGAFYPGTQPVSAASLPLPSGAATDAKQTTQITALQSIQNLVGALADVNVDELRVNVIAELPAGTKNIGDVDVLTMPTTTVQAAGGDKILSFESIVDEAISDSNLSTGVNNLDGTAVPTNKVWKITNVCIRYTGTPPTNLQLIAVGLASNLYLIDEKTIVSDQWYFWRGEVYMSATTYLRLTMEGATATDDALLRYAGVQMDAP